MKIIDERGKLFGRINIIDLFVILAVIAVVAVLGMKLLGGGGGGLGGSTKLTYIVKVNDVSEDVYVALQELSMPDQLMAAGDLLNGKVLSMSAEKSTNRKLQVVPDIRGVPVGVTLGEMNTYDVKFTIEAYVANAVKSELGTQEVRVGKTHIVKTQNFEMEDGVIISCLREKIA